MRCKIVVLWNPFKLIVQIFIETIWSFFCMFMKSRQRLPTKFVYYWLFKMLFFIIVFIWNQEIISLDSKVKHLDWRYMK